MNDPIAVIRVCNNARDRLLRESTRTRRPQNVPSDSKCRTVRSAGDRCCLRIDVSHFNRRFAPETASFEQEAKFGKESKLTH